jgi:hypothetical protein
MTMPERILAAVRTVFITRRHVYKLPGLWTFKPIGAVLGGRSIAVLTAYLEKLGVDLTGDAYIFRNRSGASYSKDTLGDDFRDVRAVEFGPLERRTIGHHMRRTGAGEAIVGDAQPAHLARDGQHARDVQRAVRDYVPVNVATLRSVAEARRKGRARLR